MWENNEAFAKLTEPSKTFYPQGEKVIVENDLSDVKEENTQLHLAYKFNIYAADPVSRAYIYVDAITGKILMKDDIIKKVAATGQADTATAVQEPFIQIIMMVIIDYVIIQEVMVLLFGI